DGGERPGGAGGERPDAGGGDRSGAGGDDRPVAAGDDRPDEGGAPTPLRSVREVMGEVRHDPEGLDMEAREVVVGGARWRVEALGSGRSGIAGDAGAPLLLLRFSWLGVAGEGDEGAAESDAPESDASEPDAPEPIEAWAVGVELDQVPDWELEALLEREWRDGR
ncbi:MAG: hypothetical protein EA351_08880, partial [Gemmatimonadales bacterium]